MLRSTVSLSAVLVAVSAASAMTLPPRGRQLEYDPKTGQWVEAEPPVPGTAVGDLQIARQNFARNDYGKAYRQVQKWLKTYGPDQVLYPEALLLRAEVEIARGDYYKALGHLKEFQNEFGDTELGERAAAFEFVVAEVFLAGKRRKVLGIPLLKAEDKGIEALDELSAAAPESSLAEAAVKTKADYYYRVGEYLLSEAEFARLMEEFPRSQWYRYAMRRSAEAALASFGGIEFDDAPLIEAEERFNRYVNTYAGSAEQEGVGLILQQIHSQRAEKEYSIGQYYERTGHPKAAAFYYRSTMENWPGTIAATRAEKSLARLPRSQPRPAPAPVSEPLLPAPPTTAPAAETTTAPAKAASPPPSPAEADTPPTPQSAPAEQESGP